MLRLAVQMIFRNPTRSLLTMLGIIIGVASVITMVTLGQGATAKVTSDVAKLGSNLVMVMPGEGTDAGQAGSADLFTIDDVQAIEDQIYGVKTAAPATVRSMSAVFGAESVFTSVVGTDNRYLIAGDWTIEHGRDFLEGELRSASPVCIIGPTVREELFGEGNPLEESIRLRNISCRIIGVLESKGGSTLGQDQDNTVLIPLQTFQNRIGGTRDVAFIYVSVTEGLDTVPVQREIEELLAERRHIDPGDDRDFSTLGMEQITSMLTTVTGILTGFLAAIAAISLLVGGIGIMNIMLVSVTERTREIGIRLAIGALESQVLMQFLIESMVISLFGGILGIALGLGVSALASMLLGVPFVLDFVVVVGAFFFSALVGIVFGYFPARRAARLDPIVALRHE
jgi:putative ABC transport system permease protein